MLDKGTKGWPVSMKNVRFIMTLFPNKHLQVMERFAEGYVKAGLPGEPSGFYKISAENRLSERVPAARIPGRPDPGGRFGRRVARRRASHAEPRLVDGVDAEIEKDADDKDVEVDKSKVDNDTGQLHWPDVDGMFPSGNRGWSYAGYNADHGGADGACAHGEPGGDDDDHQRRRHDGRRSADVVDGHDRCAGRLAAGHDPQEVGDRSERGRAPRLAPQIERVNVVAQRGDQFRGEALAGARSNQLDIEPGVSGRSRGAGPNYRSMKGEQVFGGVLVGSLSQLRLPATSRIAHDGGKMHDGENVVTVEDGVDVDLGELPLTVVLGGSSEPVEQETMKQRVPHIQALEAVGEVTSLRWSLRS